MGEGLHIKRIVAYLFLLSVSVLNVMAGTASPELYYQVEENTDGDTVVVKRRNMRLGTNMLYDVAMDANLSYEYGFSDHFAVELLCTFSPWNINSTTRLRTLILQPEFKYYFKKGFIGHHVGVECHLGWYNVSLPDSDTRYQDVDGNTPTYGGGIVYGYYLPITKNRKWGIDFSVGMGYARFDYDCFYNIPNGAKFGKGERDYWGITKLGITIFYNFRNRK